MSSTKKDIGFGLLAGMGIGTLLIGGMFLVAQLAPLPDILPASVQEVIAAPPITAPEISPPTESPLTFPIPTTGSGTLAAQGNVLPSTAAVGGELLISGNPLTSEEQAELYYASLGYVSTNFATVKAIGERINGVGYGHPSNICGPLAIAILKDARIVSKFVKPYDFWLLNPDVTKNRIRLAETFPKERFENWRDTRPLNKIDWAEFPLMPGDFLYLYSGSRGNFEHMLVVTRVDEEGFIITEALLYAPQKPGEGLFYEWTTREKALLGSTGFNGFELWRLRER